MSRYLILSVKPYDFENKDGERVQGAKIAYINKKPSTRENEAGHPPMLVNTSNTNLLECINVVPGIYELEFEQVTGKNNKPEILLSEAECCSPVDLLQLFE